MIKLIIQSVRQTILWSIVAGVMYPVVMTIFAQVAFHNQANGSLVEKRRQDYRLRAVGAAVSGHQLLLAAALGLHLRHGASGHLRRPVAATWGRPAAPLQTNVMNNIAAFISGNNLPTNTVVPADMVFASASGLDPHISPEAARLQIARVAASRGMSEDKIKALVDQFIEPPQWGFLGQARVNVLLLNVALDKAQAETKKADNGAPFKG